MIFLDVTAACLLPLQSGIPRTTRGLHRLLAQEMPDGMTPLFWQPFRGCYTRLSPRSGALLENPFVAGSIPRDSTIPLLRAAFSDLRFWPKAVPLPRDLRAGDTLLLTSLFPDNRLGYLHRLANSPGRKIAIFHDAIPLHDPNVSAWEKNATSKRCACLRALIWSSLFRIRPNAIFRRSGSNTRLRRLPRSPFRGPCLLQGRARPSPLLIANPNESSTFHA